MCKECFACCQAGINCFNAAENVRNNEAALITDHEYLKDNLLRLQLIKNEVQQKDSNSVANELESGWLQTAKRLESEVVGILKELDRVLQNNDNCRCWYLICWCNLGRRAHVIRTRLEERLGVPCAKKIEEAIDNDLQAQREPVIRLLSDEQTVFLINRSFDKFWEQFDNGNGQVIGIHGMIGIGKSTFLKKVNDEFYANLRSFDMVIFVPQSSISNIDEEVRRIQQKIAERLGTTLPEESELRRSKLRRILSRINVLLLLDNLLHGVTLSSLGVPTPTPAPAPPPAPAPALAFASASALVAAPPLPPANATDALDNQPKICKVIFTARKKLMGSNIGAPVHEIELDLLSKKDARKLLKSIVWTHNPNSGAIRSQQFTDEHGKTKSIEGVADEIADMCGGLPLALDIIGEHLRNLSQTEEWSTELRRLGEPEQASDNPEGIVYGRLKEAYDSFTERKYYSEKKCFLYCSLFPMGHAIDENDLKRHWTVEEYLGRVTGNWALHAYFHSAVTVIEKLKRAHLLSSSKDHQSSVKMHSQFHCMARWIGRDRVREENFGLSNENLDELSLMSEERRRQVKRIFFMSPRQGSLGSIDCPNLSTLVIRNNFGTRIEPDFINSVHRSLKVLDLASCTLPQFQQNLNQMTNLLYLNLSHTNIETFPFVFRNMSKLKFLDLSFMEHLIVTSLRDLSALTDLRLLNFYYCGPCERGEVGSTLLLLQDIENLNHLGDLAVTISGNLAFQKLENFSKLNVTHSMVITNCDGNPLELQFIATAMNLKVLHVIRCLATLNLPQNAVIPGKCFVNLCNVEIINCWNLEDLTWLKYARVLQLLKIARCPKLTTVIDSGTEANPLLFDQLRNLEVIDLQLLSCIYSHDLQFSSLESIVVRDCGELETIPIAGNDDRIMWPVIECQRGWWDKMGNDPRKLRLHPVFRP